MVDAPFIPGVEGRERRPLVGYAMVMVAAVLFAVNGTVSKVVLASGISSLELVQVRSTGAFLGFVLVLAVFDRGSLRLTRAELPWLVAYGVLGVALVQWLYFLSIHRLPIGIALLIEYLGPLLVALWARYVFHERVRRRIWAALTLAIAGLAVIVEIWSGVALDGVGVLTALGAAFALAAYVLLAERGVRTRSPASLSCFGFFFASLFWVVVQPVWRFPFGRADESVSLLGNLDAQQAPVWLLLLFIVVVGTMVTFFLVASALRHVSATRTGIVAMLEPVVATAVAFAWLGESFGAAQLLGGGIVLAGILLAQTAR